MSGTTTASKDPQSIAGNTGPVDASKLHLLVYSFLLQNNHGRTAQAFARTSGLATSGHLASDTTPAYLSTPFTNNVATDTLPAAANGCGKSSSKKDAQGIEGNGRKDSAVDGDVKQPASSAGELVDHHIEYLRIRQSKFIDI
ncbi:hypothetical protein H4R99_006684 [Coemansia sp. RSA 1722]|nr:hypothetical protein H4R99_006684 [Coemansia sp. RSA 1722]